MVSRSTNTKSVIPVLEDTNNNNANNVEIVMAMKIKRKLDICKTRTKLKQ